MYKWYFLIIVSTLHLFNCSNGSSSPAVVMPEGELTSSKVCGECHQDIYLFWRGSDHAKSARSSNFLLAIQKVEESFGNSAVNLCLTCHAPNTIQTKDYSLEQTLTKEGVGCDFCHSLREIHPENRSAPFVMEIGSVKFGPISDSASDDHEVAFSPLFVNSKTCAGCHEYTSPSGVHLLSTYSEWGEYFANGGQKDCQDCHMELSMVGVNDPRAMREHKAFVNVHRMPDTHSISQLRRSLRLRIMSARKIRKSLEISVEVANVGAGHAVPTGSALKKVMLQVEVLSDSGFSEKAQRTYERVVLDQNDQPVLEEGRIIIEAAKIAKDTRIKPGEQRLEDFSFSVPEGVNIEIRASLTYSYSPHNDPENEMKKVFFTEKRSLISNWTHSTSR